MKTLYLSDLHLGNPLFESEDIIMELLCSNYDQIFLVGDIIDTWEDDAKYIVMAYKELIDTINELGNVNIIIGNHDPSLTEMKEIFPNVTIVEIWAAACASGFFIITHGHEFDYIIKNHSWMAKLLFPIQWVFQQVGINLRGHLRDLYHSISAKIQKKYYNALVLEIEKAAVEKHKGCKYVIMGHTHMPKLVEHGDKVYINCGDWVHNKSYVEYENGEFRLMRI